MPRKIANVESNTNKTKSIFNLGEQRKDWLKRVAATAGCYEVDIVCMLIDEASVEDPENFAGRMKKVKAKRKIEDIERRQAALDEEKAQAVRELEGAPLHEYAER